MDLLDKEIQKTIEYGRQFGVIYDAKEIGRRLISNQTRSVDQVEKHIQRQGLLKVTTKLSPYFARKLEIATSFAKNIEKYFPDILMVAVTGSVAAGYCKKTDDIDLMIITKSNRLWLNRLLLRVFVLLNKIPHRKFGQKEMENDLCFNLWMEEDEMTLPTGKRCLRNAMDTILMIPTMDKGNTYEKFLLENAWVKKYVASGYSRQLGDTNLSRVKLARRLDIMSLINWLVFWPQWWYMKGRISTEVVSLKRAFFHPSDRIRYVGKDIC